MSTAAIVRPSWPARPLELGFRGSLGLLTAVVLLDPANKITHSKEIFFALCILSWAALKCVQPLHIKLNHVMVAAAVSLALPVLGMLSAILQNTATSLDDPLGFAKAFLFFVLLVPVLDQGYELPLLVTRLSWFLVAATFGVFIIAAWDPIIFSAVYGYTLDKEIAIITTEREIGFGQYFFKASPVMVFGLAYYLYRAFWQKSRMRDTFFALLFFIGLFLSGSRANIACAGLLVIALPARKLYGNQKILAFLLAAGALFLGGAVAARSFLNPHEESNQVKAAHYRSYLQLLEERPVTLLVGQGMGSQFYTAGFDRRTINTELTYMDVLRMFGVPVSLLFAWFLVYPLRRLLRIVGNDPFVWAMGAAYACYVLIAGTNPLLLSSTGMLVLVMIYSLRWRLPA